MASNKKHIKLKTILSSVEPLTEEEKIQFKERKIQEWFNHNSEVILELASKNQKYAGELVEKCLQHEKLRLFLVRELKKRRGKGGTRSWDTARYSLLLINYYLLLEEPDNKNYPNERDHRDRVLETLAEEYNLKVEAIERRITKARKIVQKKHLPEFAHSILLKQKRKGRNPA